MKRLISFVMAFLFVTALGGGAALAKPCRDAKGKFIKCPPPVVTTVPKRCRDSHGKFTKCKSMMTTKK